MTTSTSIADGVAGLALPAGLPSSEALTQLANQFFAALPGATPPTAVPVPALAGVPTPPLPGVPSTAGLSPAVAPVPELVGAPPASTDLPGEEALYALLAPPVVAPLGLDGPGGRETRAAYYFLDEALGLPPADPLQYERHLQTAGFSPLLQPAPQDVAGRRPFDVASIRADFPILSERVHGRPLVWLDNAATTQKPQAVIERLVEFYTRENSNIHRAAHELAARSTDAYEGAREKVRRFLNAPLAEEIIFVRGTTEGINLVAQSWGRQYIGQGDEIIITWLEHHANIVPWQQLCAETGARLKVVPVDDQGQVLLDAYERLFTPRTRLVSFSQVSNALGTVTPAAAMVEIAHRRGARVLVDGAQAVSHMAVDVQRLDCDWYVFSGHKVFGPTGIGAVYGKKDLLDTTRPWQGGGNMIQDVTFERTLYQAAPARFEAGTGNIADAVGLGAALDYLDRIGMDNIARYEHELLLYGMRRLAEVPGLRLIGTAPDKASVLSFVLEGHNTEEVGKALDAEGIAVRAGHHCAQPILRRFGLEATVRPSLAFYNTYAEIDLLTETLQRLTQQSTDPRR